MSSVQNVSLLLFIEIEIIFHTRNHIILEYHIKYDTCWVFALLNLNMGIEICELSS